MTRHWPAILLVASVAFLLVLAGCCRPPEPPRPDVGAIPYGPGQYSLPPRLEAHEP